MIGVFAIINWVIATAIGGAFLSYMINSSDIQSKWKDACDGTDLLGYNNPCDIVWYDIGYIFPYGLGDEGGNWTDDTQAAEYQTDILEDCGTDIGCLLQGTRWSVVYAFCGITLMLVAANAGIQLIGVWSYHMRALSACCGSCLNCVVFAAIITTSVFRFNT